MIRVSGPKPRSRSPRGCSMVSLAGAGSGQQPHSNALWITYPVRKQSWCLAGVGGATGTSLRSTPTQAWTPAAKNGRGCTRTAMDSPCCQIARLTVHFHSHNLSGAGRGRGTVPADRVDLASTEG